MPCGATYLSSVTLSMMKPYDTCSGFSGSMGDCKSEAPMDGELHVMEVLLSTVQFYKQTDINHCKAEAPMYKMNHCKSEAPMYETKPEGRTPV